MSKKDEAIKEAAELLVIWEGYQQHAEGQFQRTREWLKTNAGYVEIDVDICWDESETFQDALEHVGLDKRSRMKNFGGVSWYMIQEVGPGGGWPNIMLWGPKDAVRKIVLQMCDGDESQADEVMS